MFLFRFQHLLKSKEVFLSAAVVHRAHWHETRGSQVAHARSPVQGWARAVLSAPSARLPAALGHSNADQTKMTNSSLFYWKLHALRDPRSSATKHVLLSLLRLKAFPGEVIQHEIDSEHSLLGQLYFAFPIPAFNDIFLIPNLCWGVFTCFCFSSRDLPKETQTLAWLGEEKVTFDLPTPNHISHVQKC